MECGYRRVVCINCLRASDHQSKQDAERELSQFDCVLSPKTKKPERLIELESEIDRMLEEKDERLKTQAASPNLQGLVGGKRGKFTARSPRWSPRIGDFSQLW